VAAVPAGWALCNGSNGTPDLTGRFLVGAGAAYNPGDIGGADTVVLTEAQLPAHSHSVNITSDQGGDHNHTAWTDAQGDHSHAYYQGASYTVVPSSGSVTRGYLNGNATEVTRQTDVKGAHGHNVGIGQSGNHQHAINGNTGSKGSGAAIENRPMYYALAYIMKTA
jgi:hypothetical protein